MNRILKIIVTLLLFSGGAFAQVDCLNTVILLDDTPVGEARMYGSLYLGQDSFPFRYIPGQLVIDGLDCNLLQAGFDDIDVIFDFYIHDDDNLNRKQRYSIELPSTLLLQRYLILYIFDFDTKENKKRFADSGKSFGFEYDSPLGSKRLPKTRRWIRKTYKD